jgi:signal transduction histidine kinase
MADDKRISILLVEKEEKDFIHVKDVLSQSNHLEFNIDWAGNIEEAVDKMQFNPYDICLFGYSLGDHTGLDLLQYSVENHPHLPVIIISEEDNYKIDCLAQQHGASDYLIKDQLNPALIGRSIRYAIEQKKQQSLLRQNTDDKNKPDCNNDKFFSIVSHDLRSPLAATQSLTDLMLTHYDAMGRKERLEYLAIIKDASENALKMIDNLFQWSRIHRGKIEFVPEYNDLYKIVIQSIGSLKQSAEKKKIRLNYQVDMNTMVYADANMIETVFYNLVSNAVKYTSEGGDIEVKTHVNDSVVELSVLDTGVGMSEKMMNNIFNFDKNKSTPGTASENGTGLGLVLCKEFITLNGGKIWAESTLGKGSKFSVSIPKHASKYKPKKQVAQP